MFTEKIDCLIFGYRLITVHESSVADALSRLMRKGIPAFLRCSEIMIRERDLSVAQATLSGIEYVLSDLRGMRGEIVRIKHKPVLIISLLISVGLMLLSSNTVWDVRISGNERLPNAFYVELLSEHGLEVGDFWSDIDRSSLEVSLLSDTDQIAWVNLNRRGSVAYLEVVESALLPENSTPEKADYSNIVASRDCIIEEITVTSGRAVVKVGDAVRKGELLVIGVEPEEFGGALCAAEAQIIGRINETVSVSVFREYTEKQLKSEKLASLNLKIFKLSGNIFKNYGNLPKDCDIIENVKVYAFFGNAKLPLTVRRTYYREYEHVTKIYSDEELIRVAMARLVSQTMLTLSSADLVSIRTSGEFTELGYSAYNHVVYTCNVAELRSLSVE